MRLFVFFALLGMAVSSWAQDSMKKLLSSPDERMVALFMGVDLNTRLDMIDYFEGGYDIFSQGPFKSDMRITKLDDRHVRFESNTPVSVDAWLLTPGADSLMVFVVSTPIDNGDAIITVNNLRKGGAPQRITPLYSDWLKADALKNVSEPRLTSIIPFVTASATVDEKNNTVKLTNTWIDVPGIDRDVISVFKPSLTYGWNGRSFVLKK